MLWIQCMADGGMIEDVDVVGIKLEICIIQNMV